MLILCPAPPDGCRGTQQITYIINRGKGFNGGDQVAGRQRPAHHQEYCSDKLGWGWGLHLRSRLILLRRTWWHVSLHFSCMTFSLSMALEEDLGSVRHFRPRLKCGWNGWFQPRLKCGWNFADQPQGSVEKFSTARGWIQPLQPHFNRGYYHLFFQLHRCTVFSRLLVANIMMYIMVSRPEG